MAESSMINLVFDGPPDADGPRLVEVETDDGKAIDIDDLGTWVDRGDGHWALRIRCQAPPREAR